jgi:hypothetical protein
MEVAPLTCPISPRYWILSIPLKIDIGCKYVARIGAMGIGDREAGRPFFSRELMQAIYMAWKRWSVMGL